MKLALTPIIRHLEKLVGFDTQNPPRNLDGRSHIWDYLRGSLPDGFDIDITDHGKGRVSFFAVRGAPELLFNVHLDTVPVLQGARHPPLELVIEDGRAHGRGACDIKGAAACLMQVAVTTSAPMALLFTSDEEGAEGCCVNEFIAAGHAEPFRQVVVAEPTGCLAETRHRGYLSVKGQFSGVSGHSSEPRSLADNAIHRMACWSAAAIEAMEQADAEDERSCFNIGTVEGGVKSNVIADRVDLHWSARLQAGQDNEAFLDRMNALESAGFARWHVPFSGPPLPNRANGDEAAAAFALARGLAMGDGLDFWTEASLFSAEGTSALVLGPGHIEQAHAVDEWVELDQLQRVYEIYSRLVNPDA
ncbi:MAG: acetylornithine deacetylase [Gammaproteobacteria bacterium]|nr:acetylornithine deacetylase [Gammaproteobacteria bacterium]